MDHGTDSNSRRARPPASRRRARWYAWLIGGCLGMCIIVVIGCAVLGGAITGLVYTFSHEKQATATTSALLLVSGTPTVNVTNAAGSITIMRGGARQVKVEYSKHAVDVSQGDAERALRSIGVTISQTGDSITVHAGAGDATASDMLGSQLTVDVTVSVPQAANLDLRLASGGISVRDVGGTLTASVQAGNADLSGVVLGGSSSVRVGAGNLTFDGALANGCALDLTVGTGDVSVALPATSSSHIVADATVGDVSIANWSVESSRSGSGSTATADTAPAPTSTLKVHTDTGHITVRASG